MFRIKSGGKFISSLLFVIVMFSMSGCRNSSGPTPPRVLVFSKTNGWKHSSIPFANTAIQKLGTENGFAVDTTKNASYFTDDSLRRYHAVVFNNTTRNVLNAEQQAAFERYIQAGGGYVGIHSAADTEYEWPWYGKLMGAYFSSHPNNSNVRKATVNVTDKSHISTQHLPDTWERTDEWYNYKSFYSDLKVLAYLDENTYEGGTNGADHPIAWYHEFDGGRAFYTGGGHQDSSYTEPLYTAHLLGGLKYAMGTGVLDYSKAYSVAMPEENRFVKTILVNDLNTPMELAVAGDGRIFFSELRTANLSMYNTITGEYKIVHRFNVCTKGGTGLIGVTLDPDFAKNHFIYLYYSPPIDREPILFNLSRFTMKDDNTLDMASEKILLNVPVQINSGAHHGGSLAWDKNGNLYLSTGDSSSPFPANGYPPLDERPGDEFYALDAQRGPANTNDLKGKVLRIHPEPDGTYTIPDGNLFPKGTEKTRPEIFVMGCRNPYRIAVNPKTSVLYWGEIGPDAGNDGPQGPRGYDEFNQAKKAGNFGWPYFVGNNKAYAEWDFAKNTAGPLYVAEKPINNSPNNTGLNELPPAQSAMIWYPYAASPEFPELGQGGRSAMAGSFYTFDKASSSKTKFPDYYDGALFVFDWMRNWVLALRFDKDENYVRSEPFMSANGDFRRPIDMAFGRDGVMYMLEYGSVYGADNDDARLVKIEYNTGNRAPVAKARVIDSVAQAQLNKRVFLTSENRALPIVKEAVGETPLRVKFGSMGTNDPDDDDNVTYEWLFDGKTVGANIPNPTYTYTTPGTYAAVLRVTDKAGLTATDTIVVKAGNDRPQVAITSKGNRSFYWGKKPFNYTVVTSDREDGKIAPGAVKVFYDYNPEPGAPDASAKTAGVSASTNVPIGYALIQASDCKACHTIDKPSVGPTYTAVAQRYKGKPEAIDMLTKKVIAGGGGTWGKEHVMSAHPQLDARDVTEMVKYIISLSRTKKEKSPIPAQGTLTLNDHQDDEPRGMYKITATYTDKGANGVGPITKTDVVTLRPAKVRAIDTDAQVGIRRFGNNLSEADHKSFMQLNNIDLTGIKKFIFEYSAKDKNGVIEVRMDSQAGPIIAKATCNSTGGFDKFESATAILSAPQSGMHNVYFVVVKPDKPNDDILKLNSIEFVP
ncbi:ThuA domain-containing protein [Chryseolinea lacunae]|uniref:ThuA domain-containing protein n=1 Tax=Chryseolinea lacunae TaxID=2801331 RepID=A0ABS1KYI0_9BACT|nr:ThuA domain-containing protein [Chryseolinea lacunae]MBL0744338.1 ThuA domain-containing protein [Chryseolinea lacunae]